MRFLLFNLMVVGALWFLFTDDRGPTAIETMVEDARSQVGSVVAAAEQALANGDVASEFAQVYDAVADGTSTEGPTEPVAEESPVTESEGASRPVPAVEVSTRAEPIPAIPPAGIVPTGMKPVTEPKVIERRDEVVGAGPATVVASAGNAWAVDPAALMSPRERQRELHRLAQDMELLFADKLSQ